MTEPHQHPLQATPLVLVDAGAAGGLHPRWRRFENHLRVHLFEPDPTAADQLKSLNGANVTIWECALSDREGSRTLYRCREPELSSLHRPDQALLHRFPHAEGFDVLAEIPVQTRTLDQVFAGEPVDFLDLDVQGHEAAVLRGGQECCRDLLGIHVEVSFVGLYHGQALFHQIDALLRDRSLALHHLRRICWRRQSESYQHVDGGQPILGEALYLKEPEQLTDADETRLLKAGLIYAAYGRYDLLRALLGINADRFGPATKARIQTWLARDRGAKTLPEFRGKGRIHRWLQGLQRRFQPRRWFTIDDPPS